MDTVPVGGSKPRFKVIIVLCYFIFRHKTPLDFPRGVITFKL